MKIKVTFEVDTPQEAREVLSAVEKLGTLPYRLDGFGTPLVKGELPMSMGTSDYDEEQRPVLDVKSIAAKAMLDQVAVARKNISPGEPSITKIGSNNRDGLLLDVREGRKPSDKWNEHLKLLWKRGEVKYDGEEYYV